MGTKGRKNGKVVEAVIDIWMGEARWVTKLNWKRVIKGIPVTISSRCCETYD